MSDVHTCSCGARWPWEDVPSIGEMSDGEGGTLDLKNCPVCGSTRSASHAPEPSESTDPTAMAEALEDAAELYEQAAAVYRESAERLRLHGDAERERRLLGVLAELGVKMREVRVREDRAS